MTIIDIRKTKRKLWTLFQDLVQVSLSRDMPGLTHNIIQADSDDHRPLLTHVQRSGFGAAGPKEGCTTYKKEGARYIHPDKICTLSPPSLPPSLTHTHMYTHAVRLLHSSTLLKLVLVLVHLLCHMAYYKLVLW